MSYLQQPWNRTCQLPYVGRYNLKYQAHPNVCGRRWKSQDQATVSEGGARIRATEDEIRGLSRSLPRRALRVWNRIRMEAMKQATMTPRSHGLFLLQLFCR